MNEHTINKKLASKNNNANFFSAKGQALVVIVLVIGATILGVSTVAGFVMLENIRNSTDMENSVRAIYGADSGIEKCLYLKYQEANIQDSPTLHPCNFNYLLGASGLIPISVIVKDDTSTKVVRSVGNSLHSWRDFGFSY